MVALDYELSIDLCLKEYNEYRGYIGKKRCKCFDHWLKQIESHMDYILAKKGENEDMRHHRQIWRVNCLPIMLMETAK